LDEQEIVELLSQDADSRSLVSVDGLTKYATSPIPLDHLPFGSCTASSTSKGAWGFLKELEIDSISWNGLREKLIGNLKLNGIGVQVLFTPSGTDAEALVSHVLTVNSDKILRNLVVAPKEIGSGSALAAGGLWFDELAADGSMGVVGEVMFPHFVDRIQVERIVIRLKSGKLLSKDAVTSKCLYSITDAVEKDQSILIHLVAGSKTSVHAPSRKFLEKMQELLKERIHIVVDAAQGRFSRSGIKGCLERGWIVMVTGSKFFGGPPFSGAVLFPKNYDLENTWNPELSSLFDPNAMISTMKAPENNIPRKGQMLRWSAALEEISSYYSIPKRRRFEFLKWFEEDVSRIFQDESILEVINIQPDDVDKSYRLLQSNTTVVSFMLRKSKSHPWFGVDELRKIHRSLMLKTVNKLHLGQPVGLTEDGEVGALRLAFGGVMMQNLNKLIESGTSEQGARGILNAWLEGAFESIREILKNENNLQNKERSIIIE